MTNHPDVRLRAVFKLCPTIQAVVYYYCERNMQQDSRRVEGSRALLMSFIVLQLRWSTSRMKDHQATIHDTARPFALETVPPHECVVARLIPRTEDSGRMEIRRQQFSMSSGWPTGMHSPYKQFHQSAGSPKSPHHSARTCCDTKLYEDFC